MIRIKLTEPSKSQSAKAGLLSLLFLFLITYPFMASQGKQYLIKAWMIEDGLPQNSITTIQQTREGYLWLGTPLGVIRFNGTTFPINNIWNTPELKNNKINTLLEDRDGRLWIGTDGGGITLFKDNTWTPFPANNKLSSQHIQVIFQETSGTIWIGTSQGLHSYKNQRITAIAINHTTPNHPVTAICEDSAGNLWIGTEGGLVVRKKDSSVNPSHFARISQKTVSALYPDHSGIIWIGTSNGLLRFKENRITVPFPAESGLASFPITSIYLDKNHSIWIGTYGEGLYLVNGDRPAHFTAVSGLTDNFIQTITEDREKNIWIGTYTGGMIRMKPRIISTLGKEDGLPEDTVTCVLQDERGSLWIGTRHRGLCRYKNERLETIYSTETGLGSNRINSLFQTKNSDIWVGTEQGGLSCISVNGIKTYTTRQGLLANTVNALCQDHTGILWVGTSDGLNGYINDTFINREGLKGHSVTALFEDSGHNLWVGSQIGLSLLKHETIQHFNANGDDSNYEVLAIYESENQPGVIWVGTNGTGLLRLKGDKITRITTKNGLYSNYIFSLIQTGKGDTADLWMSGFKGIFRVSIGSLNRLSIGESDIITSTFFNESDGMKSSECMGGIQPAVWKAGDETLYFPTIKGLAILNPGGIPKSTHDIPVIIEDVIIDNLSYISQDNPRIATGKRMFEFYFTALNYTSPGNTQFRYKLEGFEDRWTVLSGNQKRTALYFNLSPGTYSFRVIACDHLGQWNRKGARFDFKIQSDFKESLLIYIPRILILLVFLAGFLIWRLQKKKPKGKTKKYQTSALTPERAEEVQSKLLSIMEDDKIYLNPDLTLKKLSEKIMVHPNHLSRIVNEKFQQSFNDFINSYRIEEAKEKFNDPEEKNKTILEIAYDVGFYSKSVFNTAFKKFTGMTPSRYKEKTRH